MLHQSYGGRTCCKNPESFISKWASNWNFIETMCRESEGWLTSISKISWKHCGSENVIFIQLKKVWDYNTSVTSVESVWGRSQIIRDLLQQFIKKITHLEWSPGLRLGFDNSSIWWNSQLLKQRGEKLGVGHSILIVLKNFNISSECVNF